MYDPTYWIDLKAFLESPEEPDDYVTYSRPIFRKGNYTSSRIFDLKTRKMARFEETEGVSFGYVPLFQVYNAYAQNIDFTEFGLDEGLNDKLLRLRDDILQYTIPIIEIDQSTGIESVAFIFEKVNNSGLPLDTFELLNAKLYRHSDNKDESFHLRDIWKQTLEAYPILSKFEIDPILFIQVIALDRSLGRRLRAIAEGQTENLPGVSCKKKDLFNLTRDEVKESWRRVTEAVVTVVERLSEGHILGKRWFPYKSTIGPMAVAYLYKPEISHNLLGEKLWQPLLKFYWNTIFLNRYSSSTESLMASDLLSIFAWLHEDKKPDFMPSGDNVELNLFGLTKANSAIYQGIICLLINSGNKSKDWHTGAEINHDMVNEKGVDDHHIFPNKSFDKADPNRKLSDSILNRTLISPKTNQIISNKRPRVYLQDVFPGSPEDRDSILSAHFVPEGDNQLWSDFIEFLQWRQEQIEPLILSATGWKTIHLLNPFKEEVDDESDEYDS